ncbi:hypothetical protein OIV83_000161 [Microbotryomycetes sp. JL201]|nr:hypothetical protein OIV83_000161 [Microbotryomycetes sp. JL201]
MTAVASSGRPIITAPRIQEEINQCKWLDCRIVFDSAEDLYDHITTLHIGRKSAGTLSLECKWQGCSSKASKRDHLTSHVRVHINLKPHQCSICSKAFKRPQDLKKHEKIHTEEHHQTHKHSKAVTVPSANDGSQGSASPASDKGGPQVAPQPHMPFAPFYGFPFQFMMPGQNQPALDLASLVAQQQQMNAQVQTGYPLQALGLQGMPGLSMYNHNLTSNPQAMQMLAAQAGMLPFPMSYAPFQQGQPALAHTHQQLHQHSLASQQGSASQLHMPPQSQSLYPNLSTAYTSMYPHVAPQPTAIPVPKGSPSSITNLPAQSRHKVEDTPSPAASHTSHYSTQQSQHSSSVSPRVPALSPPSMSSPEADTDSEYNRRSISSNAVAGKKRGLEEAASSFLEGLKKGRFQDEDAVAQLDQIGSYLVAPELMLPQPASHADNSADLASDFSSQAEVNKINELLLSLGQSIEHQDASSVDSYTPIDGSLSSSVPHYASAMPSYSSSLYPSLPTSSTPGTRPSYAYGTDDYFRLGPKAVAPPSIVNDQKLPTFTSIGRLTRAAPTSSERDSMDLDESVIGKAYSTSLRSTSLDAPVPKDHEPVKLAPILSSTESQAPARLPPLSSITATSGTGQPVTLPSIRDMMARAPASSSTATSSSSYPTSSSRSTAELSRPVSSNGVERLAHRVHKLDFRHREASVAEESSTTTTASSSSSGGGSPSVTVSTTVPSVVDDDSESDEDLTNDHPSAQKKSRFSSPARLDLRDEKVSAAGEHAEQVKQRRLAIIRSLIILVNAQFRQKVALSGVDVAPVTKQQRSNGPETTMGSVTKPSQLRESVTATDDEVDDDDDDDDGEEVDELEDDDD